METDQFIYILYIYIFFKTPWPRKKKNYESVSEWWSYEVSACQRQYAVGVYCNWMPVVASRPT